MFEKFIPETHTTIADAKEAEAVFMSFVKGQIHTILYASPLKLAKKDAGHTVYKVSLLQGRIGDYYAQEVIKAEKGDNPVRHARIGVEKEIVEDVVFLMKNGEIALNFLPLKCLGVYYIEDGREASLEDLLTRYSPSVLHATHSHSEQPHAMTLYASRVVSYK